MADKRHRYYWDSCVWIDFINAEEDKLTPTRHLWTLASTHSAVAARLKAGWPVERALSESRGRFGPRPG